MTIQERTYTAADLWELSHDPAYADKRLELSHGRLIVMSPASTNHGKYVSRLDRAVGIFAELHRLGETFGAETGFTLYENPEGKDVVRAPDVSFVSHARLPETLPEEGYAPIVPDLVVEVVSPNDRAPEIQSKIADYLRYGVRLVWVVYPSLESVIVHTTAGAITLSDDAIIDGGDVLPGFALPLRDLFS